VKKDKLTVAARRLLFTQSDFANQKSALAELIEQRGHIGYKFYPKHHCELNSTLLGSIGEPQIIGIANALALLQLQRSEQMIIECLDDVDQIRR
jgi:hypothetical protein